MDVFVNILGFLALERCHQKFQNLKNSRLEKLQNLNDELILFYTIDVLYSKIVVDGCYF